MLHINTMDGNLCPSVSSKSKVLVLCLFLYKKETPNILYNHKNHGQTIQGAKFCPAKLFTKKLLSMFTTVSL